MFHSARLQLTAWYLLIIMLVSIIFSVAFFNLSTREIQRVMRRQQFRQQLQNDTLITPNIGFSGPTVEDLKESEDRLKLILLLINTGIFVLAGGGGYFLAGRTLRPIQEMVDEQNRFITDASHELRTPLTVLRSELEANLLGNHMSIHEAKKLIKSNLEEVINL